MGLLLATVGGAGCRRASDASQLVIPIAEPGSLNPVYATDAAARTVIGLTMADLMHINPRTLAVEPALASSVEHRTDRVWIATLRPGLRWSDGVGMTADDVVFTYRVYAEESPGRDLLILNGKPITAKALDATHVEFDLPGPDAVGDRLFDSVWILPQHLLGALYGSHQLADAWSTATPPGQMAGMGPYVVAAVAPGREVLLRRNPHYWGEDNSGRQLPYLDQLRLPMVGDQNLQLAMMLHGQADGLEAVRGQDLPSLAGQACCRVLDGGPGLDPDVLILNQAPGGGEARGWFRAVVFRQAISQAIDRANLVRNVFAGRASALASLTSPAMGAWADRTPPPAADPAGALGKLEGAGFRKRQEQLYDPAGHAVAFSLVVQSSKPDRVKIATFLQEDLRRIGVQLNVVPVDTQTFVTRLATARDFEAALVEWGFPDADPNVEASIWTLGGTQHYWNPEPDAATAADRELDRLFQLQVGLEDHQARIAAYRRMQWLQRENLPLLPLVAGNVLAVAKPNLAGAQPALLAPHLLWNAARMWWRASPPGR